jgi:hypothetical protein
LGQYRRSRLLVGGRRNQRLTKEVPVVALVTIESTAWIIMTFLRAAEAENEYFIIVMNVVYRINKRKKGPALPPLYL